MKTNESDITGDDIELAVAFLLKASEFAEMALGENANESAAINTSFVAGGAWLQETHGGEAVARVTYALTFQADRVAAALKRGGHTTVYRGSLN